MSVGSVGSSGAGLNYEIAVAKKLLSSQEEQGKQALQLIQAAAQPTAAVTTAAVGNHLNVVA
jgi:hypothetical protein